MRDINKLIIMVEMVDELLQNRVDFEKELYIKKFEKKIKRVSNQLERVEQQKEYLFALK